jgi:hypothetical protein
MLRKMKYMFAPILVLGLLLANLSVYTAHAHNWGDYHWNKSGTYIRIEQAWVTGPSGTFGYNYAEADAARLNGWYSIPELYNYWENYHTDVSVWDAWYSDSWGGLASLESVDWDWGCWCYRHISHGHARYNNRYGNSDNWWIQGVFCQEVFHTYGFDHDNQYNCMGLGYYSGSTNVYNSHNRWDFYNRYRYH